MNRFSSISVSMGVCMILIIAGVRPAPSPVHNSDYVLSGYINTENVGPTAESTDIEANLSILGPWDDHSQPLFGSNDWPQVSFAFHIGARSEVIETL